MLSIYVATSLIPQNNVLDILTNVAGAFTIPKNMQLKLYSSKLVKKSRPGIILLLTCGNLDSGEMYTN